MKEWRYLIAAALVALVQVTLKSADINWVVPNLCLVMVVWLSARMSLWSLTGMVLIMGSILLIGSAQPGGQTILALFLVVLLSRFVFHQGQGLYQAGFQLVLMWGATIMIGLASALAVTGLSLVDKWQTIALRIGVEGLYNMVILMLLVGLTSNRQRDADRYHRMPQ